MNDDLFNNITGLLELIGQGFNKGICIIDKEFKILWINSILEKKGFRLSDVKGTFYRKTFDNVDNINEEDPANKSLKSGIVVDTIIKGKDNEEYKIVTIPVKDKKNNVEFVIEFSKKLIEYKNEDMQKLKDFIFEREIKMSELKNRVRELEAKNG